MSTQKWEEKSAPAYGGERERKCMPVGVWGGGQWRDPQPLWLLFLYVFSPPGPALCKLGWPGVLFVLPEVLTLVLGPSFVLFSQAFPFLVFQPLPFWTPVSCSNHLTLSYVEFMNGHKSLQTIRYYCLCLLSYLAMHIISIQ